MQSQGLSIAPISSQHAILAVSNNFKLLELATTRQYHKKLPSIKKFKGNLDIALWKYCISIPQNVRNNKIFFLAFFLNVADVNQKAASQAWRLEGCQFFINPLPLSFSFFSKSTIFCQWM